MKNTSKDFRVREGEKVTLKKWPTLVKPLYKSKEQYQQLLEEHVDRLSALQRLLYAFNSYAVLLIFQAMDAAGKDGAIRHVMSGVNPQACQVFSFQHPSAEELEQFAAIVSHDLREPLRTVTSYTKLLAQRYHGRLDSEADEFIAFTVAGAERMAQRIAGLLALAHIGTAGGEFRPTNLERVVEEVLADLHSQFEAAGATVERDPLPTVRGDAEQLRALLQNLFTNAVKFRHPDRRPAVRLSATKAREQWEIRVADNGIGIAEQYRERVFDVFRRLHTNKEHEGVGIGLAVSKKIVEHHGGQIWVESEPGQGATFVFTLPA
jgi:light-regulated signal transduction histidine kinase (bacteriophytochrome)